MIAKMLATLAVTGGLATGCAQVPSTPSMPPSLTLETAVQAALADASRRTGLAIDAFQVLSASSVTWRDGSLGCPQPGRVYTQALVPGYRVRVRGAGQEFDYHAGLRGAVSLCPADRMVEPLPDDSRR